jgi:hypothetical protein
MLLSLQLSFMFANVFQFLLCISTFHCCVHLLYSANSCFVHLLLGFLHLFITVSFNYLFFYIFSCPVLSLHFSPMCLCSKSMSFLSTSYWEWVTR